MQANNALVLLSSALLFAVTAQAQGTFRNLDFELAQVPSSTPPGTLLPASTAIPFWTPYVGGNPQDTVLYNKLYLGTAVVALLSSAPGNPVPNGVIQGNYTAVLEAGAGGDAAISQTGTIPANAVSIMFEASAPYGSGWTITVGGVTIPVFELASLPAHPGVFLYGGNISAFAGQTEQLRFTATLGPSPPVSMFLDAIQFSSAVVPEPSESVLIALGAFLLVLIEMRRRQERTTAAQPDSRGTSVISSPLTFRVGPLS